MGHLTYISDEKIYEIVEDTIKKTIELKEEIKKEKIFHRNIIDPFQAILCSSLNGWNNDQWVVFETDRQIDKNLGNFTGLMHQSILGSVNTWDDDPVGTGCDILSSGNMTLGEIKNKHNTVSGGKLKDDYKKLEDLIVPIASRWHGYDAYFVNILPKKPERFNKPFTPPISKTGGNCVTNEKIRIIDGASFYTLVTGERDALRNLFNFLPIVLQDVLQNKLGKKSYSLPQLNEYKKYFAMAFE